MNDSATPIGIAVVEHDGRFLVGRRDKRGPLAGFDEFPGGKCHAGESPRDCAVRECLEETNLQVIAVRLLLSCTFDYPHGRVDLHFWWCRPSGDANLSRIAQPFRWIERNELSTLQFPEANAPVIAQLTCPSI